MASLFHDVLGLRWEDIHIEGHLTAGGWNLLRVQLVGHPGLLITWLEVDVGCQLGARLGLLTRAPRADSNMAVSGSFVHLYGACFSPD